MNNARHKYFRNLRYKQKLETRYNNYNGRYSSIYFITNEVDPRAVREWGNRLFYRVDKKYRGHNYYIYYDKPEVPYTIKEYQHGRNGWKTIMKWNTARRNRRIKINEDDASWREKSFYKKYEDRWNYD